MPQFGRVPMQRLNPEEVSKLLAIAKHADVQDYLIIGLAYEGFMRVSEVLSLRAGDVLQDGRMCIHRMKGSVTNVLPIRNPDIWVTLKWLIDNHRKNKSDLLFNRNRRTMDYRLKMYGRTAKIAEEKLHMHALKHGACQNALEETGGNILAVQQLAGHAAINSTLKYAGMSNEDAVTLRESMTEKAKAAFVGPWGD